LQRGATSRAQTDVKALLARALLDAQEQERQRLAEELHDGPAQALANAIFQTEILERAIRENPQIADSRACVAAPDPERELDTLRGYINQLRPSLARPRD
jgi:two-component system sensor histidine kinase DegS